MNPAAITQQQQQQQSRKRPNSNTSFSVITPTTSHLAQQQQHQQQYSNHHQNNTPTLHMNHPNVASSSSSQYNNDTQPPLKKRRLVSLPSTIVNLVPESQILNDLQSFEYRLDRILSDKKLKMRQLLTDPKSTKRTLRIQIYCEKQTITSSSTTATTAAPASNIMVGVTPATTAPTTTTTTHADTTNITTTTTTPTDGTTPSVGGVNNTATTTATATLSSSSTTSGTTTTSNKSSYIEENWTIYIQGALLTSDTTTANNNNNNNNSSSGSSSEAEDHEFKFTHFLKSVIVEMDEDLFPLNKSDRLIEWHRTHGFEDCEGFVFTRRVRIENSSIALNHRYPMKILLGIRDDPPLYHTSPALTQILELSPSGSVLLAAHNSSSSSGSSRGGSSSSGITGDGGDYHMKKTDGMLRKKSGTSEETSAPPPLSLNNILTGVWDYIKVNKLQDQNEKNRINCDARLKELFGSDSVTFANVLQQTKQHLLLPEPKHIDYTICRTQMGQSFEQTFFIDVNVSKTHQGVVEALLSEKPLPDVLKFETQIQKALESIEDHKKNRDFMLGFSQDPINFIHRLINSQTRELLMLSNKQDLEHQRYSSYYRSPWIQDAASRYASKK